MRDKYGHREAIVSLKMAYCKNTTTACKLRGGGGQFFLGDWVQYFVEYWVEYWVNTWFNIGFNIGFNCVQYYG